MPLPAQLALARAYTRSHSKWACYVSVCLFCLIVGDALAANWEYQIRKGDTLIKLAKRHLADPSKWPEIGRLNRVKNANQLKPGAVLLIPIELLTREDMTAVAASVVGKVELASAATGSAKPLARGDRLRAGDKIRTGADGSANIEFADGSKALLLKDSELEVDEIKGHADAKITETRLKLNAGRVESKVRPRADKPSHYEVITPAVQIGVRGTDFRASYDPQQTSARTEVTEGSVNAANPAGAVDVPKDFGTVVPQGKAPAPPIALLPAANLDAVPQRIERVSPRLTWPAVADARAYRVQLARDRDFTPVREQIVEQAEIVLSDIPDGAYALRVRAIDSNGLEGKNADRTLQIKARPEPPAIETPANQSVLHGDRPLFAWTQRADAAAYHFQLAKDPEFQSLLIDNLKNPESNLQPRAKIPPGQYFWRVASREANGNRGPFSDTQSFTLKSIPLVGSYGAPRFAEQTLSVAWQPGEAGQQYRVQFSRTPDFQVLLSDSTIAEPTVEIPRPIGEELFARVQVIDSDGFVAPFGPAQRLALPSQDFSATLTLDEAAVTLGWPNAIPGQRYRLQLAREPKFEKLVTDVLVSDGVVTIPRPGSGVYFARVQVTDRDGYAAALSAPQRLEFVAAAPAFSPALLQSNVLTFRWTTALPDQRFRFQMALDRGFTRIVDDQKLSENRAQVYTSGGGEYFVRIATIDPDGVAHPFGAIYRIAIPALDTAPAWLSLPLLAN